jgi:hypothetical protein
LATSFSHFKRNKSKYQYKANEHISYAHQINVQYWWYHHWPRRANDRIVNALGKQRTLRLVTDSSLWNLLLKIFHKQRSPAFVSRKTQIYRFTNNMEHTIRKAEPSISSILLVAAKKGGDFKKKGLGCFLFALPVRGCCNYPTD